MTPTRRNSFIKKVKNISISSSLALAILGNSFIIQGCNTNNSADEEDEQSYEEVEVYSKGVKTFISETTKGKFVITDELEVPADSSVAIVSYLDGTKETLSPQAIKALIDNDIQVNSASVGQTNTLSNALLFGGVGYLLAKTLSPSYTEYRPDMNVKTSNPTDTTRRRRHHSGFWYYPIMGRYYASQSSFQKSSEIHENIGRSRTTTYRPTGGRTGFFRSTGRGSYHS